MSKHNRGCGFYKSKMFDYVSDNLDKSEAHSLLIHIASCPECERELKEIQSIISAAAELSEVEVPAGLRESVYKNLDNLNSAPRRKNIYLKRILGTALPIAACAALAFGIYSNGLLDKFINSDEVIYTVNNTVTNNEDTAEAVKDKESAAPPETDEAQPAPVTDNASDTAKVSPSRNTSARSAVRTSEKADSGSAVPTPVPESTDEGTAAEEAVPAPADAAPASMPAVANDIPSSSGSADKTENKNMHKSAEPYTPETAVAARYSYADEKYLPAAASERSVPDKSASDAIDAANGMYSGSGGGSNSIDSNSITTDAGASDMTSGSITLQSTPPADALAYYPSSVLIEAEDISPFAKKYNLSEDGGILSFSISKSELAALQKLAQENGAALSLSYSAQESENIEVTVITHK